MGEVDKSIFYSSNQAMSYNKVLTMVIGGRGIGKSFEYKLRCVKRFIEHGEQFIYIRRFKSELLKIGQFFDDIYPFLPEGTSVAVKGKMLIVNDQIAGWAIALTNWQKEKSTAYPNVRTVLFDEFILEKDLSHYIPNEPVPFLNVMDTIGRLRDNVRFICLANAVSITNPYFLYFGLIPNLKKRFNAYENILIEIPDSKNFADFRKETRLGRLFAGTDYGRMSINNEFVNDIETFIEKKPANSSNIFNVTFGGITFGVWEDKVTYRYYMSAKYDPYNKYHFVVEKDELDEGRILALGQGNHPYLKLFYTAFTMSNVRFESQQVRNLGYEFLAKLRR